jgi:hypothetical protein
MIQSDSSRIGVEVIPPARAPPASEPPNLTAEEWDGLFAAVSARLERTVSALLTPPDGSDSVALARVDVLECVEALGQLHTLLLPERDHCQRLELEIFDLRNALAVALSALAELPARPRLARSMTGLTNGG